MPTHNSPRAIRLASLLAVAVLVPLAAGAVRAASADGRGAVPGLVQSQIGRVRLPLHFEPNVGQADERVRFIAHSVGYTLFVTPDAAALVPRRERQKLEAARPGAKSSGAVMRMKLVGANSHPKLEAMERLPARVNYFIGNDPKKWRTDVPAYEKIVEREVWRGIDLVYHGEQGQVECDFIVAAGADPKRVRLAFEGAEPALLDGSGDLVLKAEGAEVRFLKPHVYQVMNGRSRELPASYLLSSASAFDSAASHRQGAKPGGHLEVGIRLAAYDTARPLIIDPILSYSSYLGGSGDDEGLAVAVDNHGRVYVAGNTDSTNFPRKRAFQKDCTACPVGGTSNHNVFVAEFNPRAMGAASLLYATYLGGSGDSTNQTGDAAAGIAVDDSGKIYVTGSTTSTDFPVTPDNAFLKSCPSAASCNTAFVTELNPRASGDAQLVYSTYLGGGASDAGTAIAAPATSAAYVAGFTSSSDFPTSPDAFQSACGGCTGSGSNVFVSQLNTAAAGRASLVYSTFLGGSGSDKPTAILVPQTDKIVVVGSTSSSNFPKAPHVFQSSCPACSKGGTNAFVALLLQHQPPAKQLLYSTYLGGSRSDSASGVGVAAQGQLINVAGATTSTDFPITRSKAFQTTCPSANSSKGCSAGFVATLIPALSLTPSVPPSHQLQYSSYLGGSGNSEPGAPGDSIAGLTADPSGDVYVTGTAASSDFPVTPNAVQGTCARGGTCRSNAFVAKLNPSANGTDSLIYSTYLGGADSDQGTAIAVDAAGRVCVAGTARSRNFVSTANAFTRAEGGGTDAFVSVLNLTPTLLVTPTRLNFGKAVVFGRNGQSKGPLYVSIRNPANRKLGLPVQFKGPLLSSGDFPMTQIGSCGPILPPGGGCTFGFTFIPTGSGLRTGSLALADDALSSPSLVTLAGIGVAGKVRITPSSGLSFGTRRVGTPSNSQFVTLINNNPVAMGIEKISVVDGSADNNFTIKTNTCGSSLAPMSVCQVGVVFSPQTPGNNLAATLTLFDDAAGSPQRIPLTGTAVR